MNVLFLDHPILPFIVNTSWKFSARCCLVGCRIVLVRLLHFHFYDLIDNSVSLLRFLLAFKILTWGWRTSKKYGPPELYIRYGNWEQLLSSSSSTLSTLWIDGLLWIFFTFFCALGHDVWPSVLEFQGHKITITINLMLLSTRVITPELTRFISYYGVYSEILGFIKVN